MFGVGVGDSSSVSGAKPPANLPMNLMSGASRARLFFLNVRPMCCVSVAVCVVSRLTYEQLVNN